ALGTNLEFLNAPDSYECPDADGTVPGIEQTELGRRACADAIDPALCLDTPTLDELAAYRQPFGDGSHTGAPYCWL
ncbi:hypothetical protein EV175_007644, partial [Coemansia sp. RSA 1933]